MNSAKYPKNARAQKTYEKLVAAAQTILQASGADALNSNAVVAEAGFTPPVFYRYFDDKLDLMRVLCQRLMAAQNEIAAQALVGSDPANDDLTDILKRLFQGHIDVTNEFEAGYEITVLMRAVPELRPIRIDSHDELTKVLTAYLTQQNASLDTNVVAARIRLSVELFYATLEMLFETDFAHQDVVIETCSQAITHIYGSFGV